ncbi:MAG TPA: hypothetical protein VK949_08025 [Methylotenera sp.]|nr:hypothetical protein [Methylotenera sp.]
MVKIYFWANALIYLFFVLWCSFRKEQTSLASGYLNLDNSGWNEYLVIYGGLQLGLAGFFAYLATHAELHRVGVVFSLFIYIGIVAYRLIGIFKFWPVKHVTLGIAFMETLLLLGAIAAYLTLEKGNAL